MDERDQANNLEAARAIFHSLNLEGWHESGQVLGSGGQATALAVRHDDNRRGVFRYLKKRDPIAIKRFHRELKILTTTQFKHPSIVNILEYARDSEHHWYISEQGDPFKPYWHRQQDRLQNDPVSLVHLAVHTISQIAEGLNPLHTEGAVHRDIKPANLIVIGGDSEARPVLIDFGVAYVEEGDRLTDVNEAVGNNRYSPDVMMNRMDQVPAWLDIFQLSQLLIWMVGEEPTKSWTRPLDWRWVNYDSQLPEDMVPSLRALTAQCSEESVSPQNASEFIHLLNQLFLQTEPQEQFVTIDYDKIQRGISKGKATQTIKRVGDLRVVESSYVTVAKVYQELRSKLEHLLSELITNGIAVRKVFDEDFNKFKNSLLGSSNPNNEATLYQLEFGEEASQKFYFRVHCYVFLPSLQAHISAPRLPETSNIFTLALQRAAPSITRVTFPNITNRLTLEHTGELALRDEQMNIIEVTHIQHLIKMVAEWVADEEAWEMIQRDR